MRGLSKNHIKQISQNFINTMERKTKSNRKRKFSSVSKEVIPEDKRVDGGLEKKSVLCIEHGKMTSCLLFLKKNQTVALQGKAGLQAIKGAVDILGYKVQTNSQNHEVFSPKSSSLLTIKECSVDTNEQKEDGEIKAQFNVLFGSQSSKLMKMALGRAGKASSILLMNGIESWDIDFICQYKEYEDLFNCDKGDKDCDIKPPEKHIHEVTSSLGFALVEADNRLAVHKEPEEWNNILTDIKQAITNPSNNGQRIPAILICGSKGVGKSTFVRFTINNLLNSCRDVYYLECDVGQTEFTPPAILSLNCVSSPLLGPPFTHSMWPERAYFYGDTSPKDNPNLYINSINSLCEIYHKTRSSKPLVINTQGWIKGLGLPLLIDIIRMTKPTHIIQINSANQPTKNLPTITREFLDTSPGWLWPASNNSQNSMRGGLLDDLVRDLRQTAAGKPVNGSALLSGEQQSSPHIYHVEACAEEEARPSSTFHSSDHRNMSVMAYFSRVLKASQNANLPSRGVSLTACTPYRVPWSHVAIHVTHTTVARSQLLVSLNASIVGLAVSPQSIIEKYDHNSGLPAFLKETPIVECIGLGVVRNIDPINKLFYILTPVPLDQLKRVNTLLKGNLEIPAHLLLKEGRPGVPYVSSEFSYDITGAGARKVRYNLQRKKFNSPARTDS